MPVNKAVWITWNNAHRRDPRSHCKYPEHKNFLSVIFRQFRIPVTFVIRKMPQKIDSPLRSVADELPVVSTKDHYTLVVLGAPKVGKTCIVNQFLYGTMPEKYSPTVEEFHQSELDFDGTTITMDIIDTSGAQEFPAMQRLNIQKGDAFLLVFSYNNKDSFEQIAKFRELILENNNKEHCRIVVVANKSDLVETAPEKCAVKRELAESLTVLDWELGFVECSAKDNKNIVAIFNKLLSMRGIPYELSEKSLLKKQKHRKSSLPAFVANPSDPKLPKRNSCNVS